MYKTPILGQFRSNCGRGCPGPHTPTRYIPRLGVNNKQHHACSSGSRACSERPMQERGRGRGRRPGGPLAWLVILVPRQAEAGGRGGRGAGVPAGGPHARAAACRHAWDPAVDLRAPHRTQESDYLVQLDVCSNQGRSMHACMHGTWPQPKGLTDAPLVLTATAGARRWPAVR